jgi:hypothetical protein
MPMPLEGALRGWSHFALQRATVGFQPTDSETFHSTSDGVLLAFLPCSPDIGWGLTRDGLAAFTRDIAVERTWTAVLEHDRLLYEHHWFAWASSSSDFEVRREYNALVESGRRQQVEAALEQLRSQLGAVLRQSLGRLAALTHPNDGCLRGDAEAAFVALAGRLGSTLPTWLDDGHGRSAVLRVCERTGIVFRATCRRRIHPDLPRQPQRVTRDNVKRIGTRFPPADPFARYALEVWSHVMCDHCGAECEARHAGRVYCSDKHKVAAARARSTS